MYKLLFIFVIFLHHNINSDPIKKDLLKDIQLFYPSEIFFEQRTNSTDNYIKGWMVIGGKGLARTEFSPPNNLVIVADGNWLILYDAQYDRTSYFPLSYGLFNILLEPKKLKDNDDYIVKKSINGNLISYTVISKKSGRDNMIELFFRIDKETSKKEIVGWNILEGNGNVTNIKITEVRKLETRTKKLKKYFSLTEAMRKGSNVFLGPYKRELKKIPNHGKPN